MRCRLQSSLDFSRSADVPLPCPARQGTTMFGCEQAVQGLCRVIRLGSPWFSFVSPDVFLGKLRSPNLRTERGRAGEGTRPYAFSSLLHRTDSAWLTGATFLTRTNVMTVASAVGRHDIRECRAETFNIKVDAVANWRAELCGILQNSRDRA